MPRPDASEHAPYHEGYLKYVPEADVLPVLKADFNADLAFLSGLSETASTIVHAPYTWCAREVVGHVNDAERIFAYRALRFARGDATPLPGFDENAYAVVANDRERSFASLVEEFQSVRRSTISLFESFGDGPEVWDRRGVANDAEISVRALAFILAGHARHHFTILRKRFGH